MEQLPSDKKYNTRILLVDDNKSIHEDFNKVLCPVKSDIESEIGTLEQDLFGGSEGPDEHDKFEDFEYEVDSAFQGQEAIDMAKQARVDGKPYALIFMDVRMPPGMDGVETICNIWADDPYAEIVICTAYSDYSWDEIIGRLGHTDKLLFLKKPFDTISVKQMALTLVKKWNLDSQARHYVMDLENEVEIRTQQLNKLLKKLKHKNKQLTDTNERLAHVAVHDSLTNIPNRVLFNDRLQHSILLASRENKSFAVCIMDLNKFKEINDNEGHNIGDQVLKTIAERLNEAFRKSDTLARLGGDEFALLLPKVPRGSIPIVADKIISEVEKPIIINGESFSVGISIGFALYPEHGEDNSTLINCADFAMYNCKRSDVKYSIYDSEEDAERHEYNKLTKDLEKAIEEGDLELHYQPIVDIKAKLVRGVEALCRWTHPEKGSIQPVEFIKIAEENNLILPLTEWVLQTAIKQCSEWKDAGHELTMSINLSANNLKDNRLPEKISESLSKVELDPKWVHIEITESMTMDDPDQAMKMLEKINDMGVSISMDDFGTGYSSLSYLSKLPIDELKIDRGFVLEMDSEKENAIIVKSTIDLAHNLGLSVVAEGIEEEHILKMLNDYGCEHAQGFHICKPQPGDLFLDWLENSAWNKK